MRALVQAHIEITQAAACVLSGNESVVSDMGRRDCWLGNCDDRGHEP